MPVPRSERCGECGGKGALMVKVAVRTPPKMGERQKALLREFAAAGGEQRKSRSVFEKLKERL